MEPQLRALGLHTTLVRGVPSLNTAHQLCKKGQTLSSEQCRILKLLGVQMAVSGSLSPTVGGADWVPRQEFRINLGSRWSKDAGFVEGTDEDSEEAMDRD